MSPARANSPSAATATGSPRASDSGWFANLGSFWPSVATAAQIETNAQGYVSTCRFDPETGTGVSDHWPVMIDLISRPWGTGAGSGEWSRYPAALGGEITFW